MGLIGHNERSAACLRRAYDTLHLTDHARSFFREGPAWPGYARDITADDARRRALHAGCPPFRGIYPRKGRYTIQIAALGGPSGEAGRGGLGCRKFGNGRRGEGEGGRASAASTTVFGLIVARSGNRLCRKRGLTGVQGTMSARWGAPALAMRIHKARSPIPLSLYHRFNLHCNHVHLLHPSAAHESQTEL